MTAAASAKTAKIIAARTFEIIITSHTLA